jgi:hypothetical protein
MVNPARRTEVMLRAAREAHRIANRTGNAELTKYTKYLVDELPAIDTIYDACVSIVRHGYDAEAVRRKRAEIADNDWL